VHCAESVRAIDRRCCAAIANTVTAILDEAVGGTGCVVNVMLPGMRQAV
jgi:hypothetical protein